MLASSRSLTAVNVLELSGTVLPPRFMENVGAEGSFPGAPEASDAITAQLHLQ